MDTNYVDLFLIPSPVTMFKPMLTLVVTMAIFTASNATAPFPTYPNSFSYDLTITKNHAASPSLFLSYGTLLLHV